MGKHYDNEFKNMVLSEYKKGTYGGRIPTAKHFVIPEGAYGYRRITEGLKIEYGVIFNHKKVARTMHKYNIKPEYIRRIRPNYSYKRIEQNVRPNLLKRNFKTDALNKVWDTDIIYLIFKGKRLYLSTIIDLYDRHVVSYKISKFARIPKTCRRMDTIL